MILESVAAYIHTPLALAVDTSTLETAVNAGFESGANSAFSMLGANASTILIVFGSVLGISLLMRVFKRAAR